MSKFINFIDLQTGKTERIFDDLNSDLSAIYAEKSPVIMGSTHYIDTDTLKLVVCKKATQAKKAWASLGLAEDDRPQTPWAACNASDDDTKLLAMQLSKYIIFYYKNNA